MRPPTTPDRGVCGGRALRPTFTYPAPPKGENRFSFSDSPEYHREFLRCEGCGHYLARHALNLDEIYTSEYAASVYGGPQAIRRAYERINSLPEDASDNAGRVRRVLAWGRKHLDMPKDRRPSVLDVGSGLCVFLHRMRAAGWDCTAMEPDPAYAAHAENVVGVKAVAADFNTAKGLGRFDLLSFNKVLEHFPDPTSVLRRAPLYLAPGGGIYVEVPDGEAAAAEGPGREEFFVEHFHAFSPRSLRIMADRAGLFPLAVERLREPSGKYTFRALFVPDKTPRMPDTETTAAGG